MGSLAKDLFLYEILNGTEKISWYDKVQIKVPRWYRKSPCTHYQISPTGSILHLNSTFVTTNEPILMDYCKQNSIFYSYSLSCCFLTRHKIPRRLLHYICFVSLGSSWLWQFLRLSLSWWFWESWRVLIRNIVDHLSLDLLVFFSWLDWGYWFGE